MKDRTIADEDWLQQRKTGMLAILVASIVFAAIWFGIRYLAPPIPGMDNLIDRMLFALKCFCVAVLFTLVLGVEAIAHERLQSPAFDPLKGHETKRLRVNLRYLQNTLEQIVVFATALFGLAVYSPGGHSMRAVLATAVVWILSRFAFWIGYHQSAALRGLGAPGVIVALLALLYVVARICYDVAGGVGSAFAIAAFLLAEAILFRTTRSAS